jgi:acyl transferase domain-containing protein
MQHPARTAVVNPVTLSSLRHDYESQPDADFILNSVGRLWLAGTEIDWEKLDPRPSRRKISLPTYPFERQRHWIQPQADGQSAAVVKNPSVQKADLADWFYIPSWERTAFATDTLGETGDVALWLIIGEQSEFASRFVTTLEKRGVKAVLACFGESYARRIDGAHEIRPACLDDYVKLIGNLKTGLKKALNVVHLGPLSSRVKIADAGYDELSQELGFYSLLNLAKAIGEQDISASVRIGVVTSQIHEVTGEEILNPAMATVLGPCGVMPKEYPNVTSFSVDLPALPSTDQGLDEMVLHLLGEFRDPARGDVIAYRGRYRWQRGFKSHKLPAVTPQTGDEGLRAQGLRRRGVYLITGGTGGIGLAIAKHLAETCQARLVLTKKSPFPEKSVWRQRLASGDLSDADQRIISALLEIEALGSEVDVFICDASDRTGMRQVVAETISRHHAIHGVIHAAGIIGVGLIQVKTKDFADRVLSSKVNGSLVLYDELKGVNLDFVMLVSSLASITMPFAHVDYCAAHAFMDAFAHYFHAKTRCRTITINWPIWREVGILAGMKAQTGVEGWRDEALRKGIRTSDGVEVFKRSMASSLLQLVVSPEELDHAREQSWAKADSSGVASPGDAHAASKYLLKRRQGTIDKPRNQVEHTVADMWSSVLGIAPIGIHESFLDLGGHSLLAMQIVSRIRITYQVNLSLGNFFANPTICGLAARIDTLLWSRKENKESDQRSTVVLVEGEL